jgi:hypothetical protein
VKSISHYETVNGIQTKIDVYFTDTEITWNFSEHGQTGDGDTAGVKQTFREYRLYGPPEFARNLPAEKLREIDELAVRND